VGDGKLIIISMIVSSIRKRRKAAESTQINVIFRDTVISETAEKSPNVSADWTYKQEWGPRGLSSKISGLDLGFGLELHWS